MDSLRDPVATVLRRLFQEAEIADGPLMKRYRDSGLAGDELTKIFEAEAKDYKAMYRTYANNFLNVSADFGRFLYMCARARKAKQIVEFGTSFGISTIHLACALVMTRPSLIRDYLRKGIIPPLAMHGRGLCGAAI